MGSDIFIDIVIFSPSSFVCIFKRDTAAFCLFVYSLMAIFLPTDQHNCLHSGIYCLCLAM